MPTPDRLIHHTRNRRTGGFTLVEVGMATALLLMMGLLFGTAVPAILRAPQFSGNYMQASELVQHKIDQLRAAGFGTLSQPAQLQGLGIISSVNPNGTYDFTAADNLTGYFPAGSTGTITLADNPNAQAHTLTDVTITIAWTGGAVRAGTYTARTMISN